MEETFQIFRLIDDMHMDKLHTLGTYKACKNYIKLEITNERVKSFNTSSRTETAIYNEEIYIRGVVSQPFHADTIVWMMVRFEYDGSICGIAVNAEKFYSLENLFQENI